MGPDWSPLLGPKAASGRLPKTSSAHYEQRLEAMDGKAMIVCMSRRICVDLYRELVAACAPAGTVSR